MCFFRRETLEINEVKRLHTYRCVRKHLQFEIKGETIIAKRVFLHPK